MKKATLPLYIFSKLKYAFAVALILLTATSLYSIELHQVTKNVSSTFLTDQEVAIPQTLNIRSKDEAGDYFITFSAGVSNDFSQRELLSGADVMYYNIYNNSNERTILKDLTANPASSEVLSGTITAAELAETNGWLSRTHSYIIILDRDQFPTAGTYEDTVVTVTLYTGVPGSSQKVDQETLKITVTMDPVLEMAIVPDGAPLNTTDPNLTLDFGTLYAGAVREADLVVRSNSYYGINLRSEQGGVMTIQDPIDTSTVPYILSVDGLAKSLPAGSDEPLSSSAAPTGITGEIYDLAVEIQEFGMATEGSYADIITITVSAQ